MNPYSRNRGLVLKLLNVILIALIVATAVVGVLAWQVRSNTSTLHVTTFASNSIITISGNQVSAAVIGTGSADVRLKPGTYLLNANSNGKLGRAEVTVQKGQNSTVHIVYTPAIYLPSPDNITFTGTDVFINHGLTDEQVANLRDLFFQYDQKAQKITINKNSVEVSHDSSDENAPFIMSFTGSIDGKAYKARISYTDLVNVDLTIIDPLTGNQLFEKSSVVAGVN